MSLTAPATAKNGVADAKPRPLGAARPQAALAVDRYPEHGPLQYGAESTAECWCDGPRPLLAAVAAGQLALCLLQFAPLETRADAQKPPTKAVIALEAVFAPGHWCYS